MEMTETERGRGARLGERARFVLAVIVTGALAGAGAIAFYACLDLAQLVFWGGGESVRTAGDWLHAIVENRIPPLLTLAANASPWKRLLLPALGGLMVGGIAHLLRGEGGAHGMAELLEVVGFGRRPTRAVNAARRVISAIVTMASGGSAGQEGPIVQLGGSLAAAVGHALKPSERERRTLVACGIGAGVAAAFNTPLGGAIFAIEVAIGSTSFDVAWPVILAAVAAQAVARLYLGVGPLYEMSLAIFRAAPARALPLCALLGALGGAIGGLYGVGLEKTSALAGRLPVPRWLRPALGGLAVGAVAVVLPEIHGNGYPFIASVTSGEVYAVRLLLVLVLAKLAATWLTLGSGGGGGIFTPSLFIGAALGGAFGRIAIAAWPGVGTTPAEFAVIGMAAVFAGTFHAPLTAIVVHLEMTRDFNVSLALIVACLAAQAATRLVAAESIYHGELARRGTSWSFTPRERALRSARARDLLREEPERALAPLARFDEIARRFSAGRDLRLYVAGERLEGAIDLHDVKSALGEEGNELPVVARDLARPLAPLAPDDSLERALARLAEDGAGELPVCDPATGRFLGVITRRDIEALARAAS
jgi:CIC family chloride channel protein